MTADCDAIADVDWSFGWALMRQRNTWLALIADYRVVVNGSTAFTNFSAGRANFDERNTTPLRTQSQYIGAATWCGPVNKNESIEAQVRYRARAVAGGAGGAPFASVAIAEPMASILTIPKRPVIV